MSVVQSVQRFFGKVPPEEQVKKWCQTLRSEERAIERQIRGLDVEELKAKKSLKIAAKKGDKTVCRMLAKELIRSQKGRDRLYTSKAQLNSVSMQLKQQLATLKVAGALQKSSEIMKLVNQLVRLPEISQQMQEFSQELMKAGIIEEMIDDTIGSMDEEDLDEEADEEVDKILFQVTDGLLGQAGSVGADLRTPEAEAEEAAAPELEKRLQALRTA
ncbi:Vacuolar protein-sorting-associated protein 24 [Sorochytrium milnesiophthora]